MQIITTQRALIEQIIKIKSEDKTIGFVPTMGALHEGHISLMKKCVAENDVAVASIFVNPTQFNNTDDLARYPRTLENDCELLEKVGVNIVFAPEGSEIYSKNDLKTPFEFDFRGLDKVMEGIFRPNHFNGVVQIVSKLFALVQPNRAYFGEKDFQQLAIIRLMTKTLNFPVEIVGCPIVREESGLALSSRNALLSETERQIAAHIHAVLAESKTFFNETSVAELKNCAIAAIEKKEPLKVEYFEIIDGNSLQNINDWRSSDYVVGCITVHCGKVRLIDNICYKK
ncbi:MAG: pantoate--beta-alanine ligase [Prevotellaceae bacterium]|jgi:pantoate--beta-alanine ligase|nr:pantoate--beta-alanine ligase [Prevotellaceae bacterium]